MKSAAIACHLKRWRTVAYWKGRGVFFGKQLIATPIQSQQLVRKLSQLKG